MHRFHNAMQECVTHEKPISDPNAHMNQASRDAMGTRCSWVLNNPDVVATLHAIRVELLVNMVMSQVVTDSGDPFLYWLRFEWGKNGNPHAHGLCYVSGNPHFDSVVKSMEETEKVS